jgi:hypothetical protein
MPDPRPMTEAQLQSAVVKLCKLYGLRWHHQRYSIGSAAGWPDLVIAGRRLLFRELKREDGKVTRAQEDWGDWLTAAGGDWGTWRPSDLRAGRIQRELEAIR